MAGLALASNRVAAQRSCSVAQESQLLELGTRSKVTVLPKQAALSKDLKLRLHHPLAVASSVSNLALAKYQTDVKYQQWHGEMTRKVSLTMPSIWRSFQPGVISISLTRRRRMSVTPRCGSSPKTVITVKDLVVPIVFTTGVALVAASVGVSISEIISGTCTGFPCLESSGPIPIWLKVPLIATHLLAFALFPTSMYAFNESAPVLGAKRPFIPVLGFAFIMVSICGEIGWHVGQQWFYQEEYNILNFMFYAFLGLGTSVWAYGVQQQDRAIDKIANVLLLLAPLLMTWIYATAAAAESSGTSGPGKVPIYIVLSAQYAILTWRLFEILNYDKKAFLFPLFSVGVNLGFIYLLGKNVDIENEATHVWNPIFHTLHDLLGTEMGVLIITVLVWNAAAEKEPSPSLKAQAGDRNKQLQI